MAVYNCAPYLGAALDGVLGQTLCDFELVIVDDASTDDTPAILRTYAQRDPRLVPLRNAQNSKLPASLNVGLAACRAPLVARADGDDLYPPTRLEKQFRFLDRHPSVGVVSGYFDRLGEQERFLGLQKLPVGNEAIKFNLLWESSVCHAAAMYRREIIQSVGGYDTGYPTAQDYDLWARLRDRTEFANLPEKMMTWRVHRSSSSALRGTAGANLAAAISQRLMSAYFERPLLGEARSLRALLCAYGAINTVELPAALRLLDELLKIAGARELPATLRWARAAIAVSLLKQARYRTYVDPRNSSKLMWKAVALHKPLLCSNQFFLQTLRLALAGRKHVRSAPADQGEPLAASGADCGATAESPTSPGPGVEP
jgi:glycosyltransferase involved in cell wall biosynthesis